ncbi:hypothetical protein TOPH_09301 [Tolypocladium ophioglossoides CBS 100239]|uniref:Uncharacterized protein n=1 Tax=Tolypocladium ophioglossoides (strain CBS 100239) TaxID=1163406 RepID=A0A0L0MT23_TOLOC|nr:hypothetical protein TOPH_09301 [Tolypocladium ophioglossoides CBS 100239]
MCNYIYPSALPNAVHANKPAAEQKELSCQHHYHLVESWCSKYIETERRCPPTVGQRHLLYVSHCTPYRSRLLLPLRLGTCVLTGPAAACRERQQPSNHPWEKLIRPPQREGTYPYA